MSKIQLGFLLFYCQAESLAMGEKLSSPKLFCRLLGRTQCYKKLNIDMAQLDNLDTLY